MTGYWDMINANSKAAATGKTYSEALQDVQASTPASSNPWHPSAGAVGPNMSGGGGGGGGGSNGPITLKADTNAALDAMVGRYNTQLDNMAAGNGRAMDLAGSRIRDAREGQRRSLQQDSLISGRASDPSISAYDANTANMEAGAIANTAATRENNMTNAIAQGVGVAGAPASMAMQEKNLQLAAINAQNSQQNNTFQQFMSMLQANRTSPIYTGY